MSVFVIGEGGSCHDGNLTKAHHLIDVAKKAGCDAVKFQFWSDAKRLADRRHADDYLGIYARYQMPDYWLPELAKACESSGIEFMCTTYLPEDIAVVAPYVKRFKIASFEAEDGAFIRAHEGYGMPVIISTGMTTDEEAIWIAGGGSYADLEIETLHCVSAYPTPMQEANLSAIRDIGFSGFSDHTRYVLTGAFAVCAGARIIEVHFRDWDTDRDNPDYGTALDPNELLRYVGYIRLADSMMGDGIKRVMDCEEPMKKYKVQG